MKSVIASRQTPVSVRTYKKVIDDYGQMHTEYTERTSNMFLTKYVQTPDSDVRYNNVVWIGLTHDILSDEENVLFGGKEYKVTHTIEAIGPVHWNQVFLEYVNNVS